MTIDSDNPPDPHCEAAGDLDGDGLSDLLAASAKPGGLYWYRFPHWTKHQIAAGAFTCDMRVCDLDGDGHQDVVIPNDEELMFYRNPLREGKDPAADPWEAVNISADGARMHDVAFGDLDGDSKLDLVTRHQSGFGKMLGNQIHLWHQVSPVDWQHRTFDCPHGEGLRLSDIDGDGYLDVVIGGRWYRNPGGDRDGEWQVFPYMPADHFGSNWVSGDVMVQTGDLTGNGRPDIALSPSEGAGLLAWYEAPEDPTDPEWVEHVVDAGMDHAHGLEIGDMDGDGQLDIVVSKMHQATPPQSASIFYNGGKGASWIRQDITDGGSHRIGLADIGQTGALDVFGANWNNKAPTGAPIDLWLNRG